MKIVSVEELHEATARCVRQALLYFDTSYILKLT